MGMTQKAALNAAAKSGGMIVVLTALSAPTKKETFTKRKEKAAANAAKHAALGRVKVCGTVETTAAGEVFEFRVAGQVNRDVHPEGVYLTKKGDPCVDLVVMAPTEYGYTTACPNAGREGSACEGRRPFHAHRTVNLTRLVSWVIAGEPQPLA